MVVWRGRRGRGGRGVLCVRVRGRGALHMPCCMRVCARARVCVCVRMCGVRSGGCAAALTRLVDGARLRRSVQEELRQRML